MRSRVVIKSAQPVTPTKLPWMTSWSDNEVTRHHQQAAVVNNKLTMVHLIIVTGLVENYASVIFALKVRVGGDMKTLQLKN